MDDPKDYYKLKSKSIKIMVMLMRLMGMWYPSNKKERIISNIVLNVCITSVTIGLVVLVDMVIAGRDDLMKLIYSLPAFVPILTEEMKLFVFILYRKKIFYLNKFTEDNFWNKKYNDEENVIMDNCDKVCFKNLIMFMVPLQTICWHHLLMPFYENSGKKDSERVLPFHIFNGLIDHPMVETPYFELCYLSQFFSVFSIVGCTFTFASFLFTINLFAASQFKILNLHLQSVCDYDGDDFRVQQDSYKKLITCVQKHQLLINYIDRVEEIYCYIMLGQVFGSVLQICMSGLQIIVAVNGLQNLSLQQKILTFEYAFANVVQLYFYCYSSHEIMTESENVTEAIYFSKWFRMYSKKIHKHFSLLIQIMVYRSRKPCVISVGKFSTLSLITFASVLKKALSFFTVLRQSM